MTAASEGSIVSIYMDTSRSIEEGDVVQTVTGRSYRVLGKRVQTRGLRKGRQHLKVLVINPEDVNDDDTVHTLYWYARGKATG